MGREVEARSPVNFIQCRGRSDIHVITANLAMDKDVYEALFQHNGRQGPAFQRLVFVDTLYAVLWIDRFTK